MNPRILVSGVILLILAAGSWWLAGINSVNVAVKAPVAHTPDYVLEKFRATTMADDGRPKQRLRAEQMVHYPDDDSTELTKPRLTLYDSTRPPWLVTSETGWVSGDGEILLLQGEVQIDREGTQGVDPIHILTSDLKVRHRENYAETSKDADVRSRGDRVRARGMQVWFNKPIHIKLLAMVRGRYEVNQ